MSVPKSKNNKITYFEAKAPIWQTNATALGVPTALATSLSAKSTAARAAFDAQQAAKAAWLTALGDCDIAVREMAQIGGQAITLIRATAKVQGNGIYTLAGLPIPPVPGPVAPPAQPRDFAVALDNGALIITWKASNPIGGGSTIYRVYRSANGAPTQYVGDVGGKKFIDSSLPVGTTMVTYEIQGVRSTAAGPWGTFLVKFGTNASGEATAAIATAPRLAA